MNETTKTSTTSISFSSTERIWNRRASGHDDDRDSLADKSDSLSDDRQTLDQHLLSDSMANEGQEGSRRRDISTQKREEATEKMTTKGGHSKRDIPREIFQERYSKRDICLFSLQLLDRFHDLRPSSYGKYEIYVCDVSFYVCPAVQSDRKSFLCVSTSLVFFFRESSSQTNTD
jgi:hypothetical protein